MTDIIRFNADQIPAIDDGRKTQTRRLMRPQPTQGYVCNGQGKDLRNVWGFRNPALYESQKDDGSYWQFREPKHQPGVILAVHEVSREKCKTCNGTGSGLKSLGGVFIPSGKCPDCDNGYIVTTKDTGKRIKITAVRCEQVQEISAEDVLAEGVQLEQAYLTGESSRPGAKALNDTHRRCQFNLLWDEIYPGSWEKNEWVWVYEFRIVQ